MLQVTFNENLDFVYVGRVESLVEICEDSNSFHLVESWIVRPVDRVFAVDITNDQECIVLRLLENRNLMR